MADIEPILDVLLCRLEERFGDQLVSVVLFGSYARGNARCHSDIDLIVVLQQTPAEWREVFDLEGAVVAMGHGLGKSVEAQVISREATYDSVSWPAPLMLEVYAAHRVLLDRGAFFGAEMQRLRRLIARRGIRRLGAHAWKVPIHEP